MNIELLTKTLYDETFYPTFYNVFVNLFIVTALFCIDPFINAFVPSEYEYELIPQRSCSRWKLYTTHGCDGWSGVTREVCENNCNYNLLPDGCRNNPNIKHPNCAYYQYLENGGWCHLASTSCQPRPVPPADQVQLYKKGRKTCCNGFYGN